MLTPEAVPPGKNGFLGHHLSGWTAPLASISILRNVRGTQITLWYTLRILGEEETRRVKERWMKETIGSCSR